MSKVPPGVERQTLYVAARRVLLDALDALAGQREALILVGAQAVYLHSGDANLAVAVYTADADLSIDRNYLNDLPRLEQAMLDGGFQLSSNLAGRQPGQWFQTIDIDGIAVEIPVDLLIPEQFSGTGKSRRTAGDARVTGVRVRPPGTRAPQWRRNPGASCRTTSTSSYASDTR